MGVTGQNGHAETLEWAGKLLSAEDVRHHLNGHRSLIVGRRTIVTPLAIDELRARGIRLDRQESSSLASSADRSAAKVGYAQDQRDTLVNAAVQALQRDGITLQPMPDFAGNLAAWIETLTENIAANRCRCCVVFCGSAALVACLANKIAGIRAATAASVREADKAMRTLGANLLSIELPGPTYFEVRQILKSACTKTAACPPPLVQVFQEMEHAHR